MSSNAVILAALQKLDVANDNHWTQDGAPRLDAVKIMAGDQTLSRDAVTQAAPGFSRAAALAAATPAPVQTPAPAEIAAPVAPEAAVTTEQVDPVAPPVTTQVAGDVHLHLQPNHQVQAVGSLLQVTSTSTAQDEPEEESEHDIALSALNHGKANLEQLRKIKDEALAAFNKQQAKVDRLQEEYDRIQPPETNTDVIQGYLATQRVLLEERAAKAQAWRQAGINLKDILPSKAPIDQAMGRRNTRGMNRPVR